MKTNNNNKAPGWVWGTALLAGGLALVAVLMAENAGTTVPNPNSLEGQIDQIVTAFNTRFGKTWVHLALTSLQTFLSSVLPPQVVALATAVYKAEHWAAQLKATTGQKISGQHKQAYAVSLSRARRA